MAMTDSDFDQTAVAQDSPRGQKSPEAFRTISEVSTDLDVPQHVLRFWETKFSQIRPLKRAGGRRYYRPDDLDLLRGIRHLLYSDGYTIKGVQKLLREQGSRAVMETGRSAQRAATAPRGRAANRTRSPVAPPPSEAMPPGLADELNPAGELNSLVVSGPLGNAQRDAMQSALGSLIDLRAWFDGQRSRLARRAA